MAKAQERNAEALQKIDRAFEKDVMHVLYGGFDAVDAIKTGRYLPLDPAIIENITHGTLIAGFTDAVRFGLFKNRIRIGSHAEEGSNNNVETTGEVQRLPFFRRNTQITGDAFNAFEFPATFRFVTATYEGGPLRKLFGKETLSITYEPKTGENQTLSVNYGRRTKPAAQSLYPVAVR